MISDAITVQKRKWHLGMRQRFRGICLGGNIALLQASADPLEVRLRGLAHVLRQRAEVFLHTQKIVLRPDSEAL